jgi:hypothetical protein
MDIIKSNKRIAKFMSIDIDDIGYGEEIIFVPDEVFPKPKIYCPLIDALQYHSSWDWLMPVLDKICELSDGESILYSIELSSNGTKNHYCWIIVTQEGGRVAQWGVNNEPTRFGAAYKAVNKFVKHFNKKNNAKNKKKS